MPPKQRRPSSSLTPLPTKTRSELYSTPFPHMTITNFLDPITYAKTFEIYNKLQFKNKVSDLFNFFQTDELNKYEKLGYFQEELYEEFMRLPPFNDPAAKIQKQKIFFNIFASYYFSGNYLLCHDDVIEDRVYAFSYYLEDHDSGDLVLFNQTADAEKKRIKVRKNTLAIFEVSEKSYHEVDYTSTDGRKAITGWINIKNWRKQRKQKTIPAYIPTIPNSKDIIHFSLAPEYVSEEYFQLMDIEYRFNVKKMWMEGPFFSRRVHKVEISPPVLFTVPGYQLFSVEFYSFREGDYILLNDSVNTIKGKQIIDIFVTHLLPGFQHQEQQQNGKQDQDEDQEEGAGDMLVKIAQPNQEASGIPEVHDSLFVVRRGKKQYYVDRVRKGKEFMLAHFVYVAEEGKKGKKVVKVKDNVAAEKKNKKSQPKKVLNKSKSKKTLKNARKTDSKPKTKPNQSKSTLKAQTKPKPKSANTRKIKKPAK